MHLFERVNEKKKKKRETEAAANALRSFKSPQRECFVESQDNGKSRELNELKVCGDSQENWKKNLL